MTTESASLKGKVIPETPVLRHPMWTDQVGKQTGSPNSERTWSPLYPEDLEASSSNTAAANHLSPATKRNKILIMCANLVSMLGIVSDIPEIIVWGGGGGGRGGRQ